MKNNDKTKYSSVLRDKTLRFQKRSHSLIIYDTTTDADICMCFDIDTLEVMLRLINS